MYSKILDDPEDLERMRFGSGYSIVVTAEHLTKRIERVETGMSMEDVRNMLEAQTGMTMEEFQRAMRLSPMREPPPPPAPRESTPHLRAKSRAK